MALAAGDSAQAAHVINGPEQLISSMEPEAIEKAELSRHLMLPYEYWPEKIALYTKTEWLSSTI